MQEPERTKLWKPKLLVQSFQCQLFRADHCSRLCPVHWIKDFHYGHSYFLLCLVLMFCTGNWVLVIYLSRYRTRKLINTRNIPPPRKPEISPEIGSWLSGPWLLHIPSMGSKEGRNLQLTLLPSRGHGRLCPRSEVGPWHSFLYRESGGGKYIMKEISNSLRVGGKPVSKWKA